MASLILRLESVTKLYGSQTAVDEVSLDIREGEFLTLLGPSGCGKTSTLRMIAGYVLPTSGRILLDGEDISYLPPQKRNIGMVFQNYALFPHMSVEENVRFGLKVRRWPADRMDARVAAMLELVQLEGHEKKRPPQLSGGQQQRVAMARALAIEPRILLTDEPMGALDVKLREHMQLELKRIQQELGITVVHVTHDQEEALSVSDRIAVMREGRIVQIAAPEELYTDPVTDYVADFLGKVSFLDGSVVAVQGGSLSVQVPSGTVLEAANWRGHLKPGNGVRLGLRPEHIRIVPESNGSVRIVGNVKKVKYLGSHRYVFVDVDGNDEFMVWDTANSARVGDDVGLTWEPKDVMVFAAR